MRLGQEQQNSNDVKSKQKRYAMQLFQRHVAASFQICSCVQAVLRVFCVELQAHSGTLFFQFNPFNRATLNHRYEKWTKCLVFTSSHCLEIKAENNLL